MSRQWRVLASGVGVQQVLAVGAVLWQQVSVAGAGVLWQQQGGLGISVVVFGWLVVSPWR